MLIRILVKNLFSFNELTEFNMLPGRFNRLPQHVYKTANTEVLKLNVIYGANGAGKSNLIRVLDQLRTFLVKGEMPIELITQTFKFDKESRAKDVYIGVEFTKDETAYYYGITINQGIIVEEELQKSGLGKAEDIVLFTRTDEAGEKNLSVAFSGDVQNDIEAALFPRFLQNEILERNKPVLHYMKNRHNAVFEPFKKALEWFDKDLVFILPDSAPNLLAFQFENDVYFREFAHNIMQSFNTGIVDIHVGTISIEDFMGEDNKHEAERITAELKAGPGLKKLWRNHDEEIVFVLQDNKAVAKKIEFSHKEDNGAVKFQYDEESDGTRRLMNYLPALYGAITTNNTYFVDEIERSIHPLLIKELIRKFSHDTETKGQLIFSTHESNLLDQDIFRPDEIWFLEKNKAGASELSTLSEFKEHHTIDIRKGYLNGRYGGIPFLGNLKDLNWVRYAKAD